MLTHWSTPFAVTLLLALAASARLLAQPAAALATAEQSQIADEPKTVDPATLMPPQLAAPATVDFTDSSLNAIVQWLQAEQQVGVLLDTKSLADAGILMSEPVSDRLNNDPLYLLLNRLRSLGLDWYLEDDLLHITTIKTAGERMSTEPYNVGDLFDAGYKSDDLIATIKAAVDGPWTGGGEDGRSIELLGDVLFVRQTSPMHREVAGLLAALRQHGRQTLTFDPPLHALLRQSLDQNVTVDFQDTPLSAAVRQLAESSGADIRLDTVSLRASRIRDREPVTLKLADRKLSTVLQALLADLRLTWILRDGVLWITTADQAQAFRKTAVFDVRDLCRDESESFALRAAIQNQTKGPWQGGGGTITFARPGTMVVRHTESALQSVLNLLENYRLALRASKPRQRTEADPNEVLTRYYRLQAGIADDLTKHLPQLVRPGTWKDDQHPEATGTILRLTSGAELRDAEGNPVIAETGDPGPSGPRALVVNYAVLIIRQTRAAHDEIAKLIDKVEQGDMPEGGGGGFGGGGFGGGLFSAPESKR
jgi:hypothetical protein